MGIKGSQIFSSTRLTVPLSPVLTSRYTNWNSGIKRAVMGLHRCISCGLCARNCPCSCIVVKGEKQEGVKGKVLKIFTLEFSKCSLCGLCVESCPVSAIDFSDEYELASFSREAFNFDLLKRVEGR